MAEIEVHGSLKNLSAAPDIAFQFQPNGQPWASVTAAHNGTPEAYRAIGKVRFVWEDGRLREYWYYDGTGLGNLVRRYDNLDTTQEYVEYLEGLMAAAKQAEENASRYSVTGRPVDPSSVPLPEELVVQATTAGTYTNFGDVTVSSEDMKKVVRLVKVDGIWSKDVKDIDSSFSTLKVPTSINLFDKTAVINDRYVDGNTGAVVVLADMKMSELFPVNPGQAYTVSGVSSVHWGLNIRYVNSAGVQIGFSKVKDDVDVNGAFTPPANTAFAQMTVKTARPGDNINLDTIQIQAGAIKPYVPYTSVIGRTVNGVQFVPDPLFPQSPISKVYAELHFAAYTMGRVPTSVNLFDKSSIIADKYVGVADGTVQDAVGYSLSPFFGIQDRKLYSITGFGTIHHGIFVRFVNANNVQVGFILAVGADSSSGAFTTPNGAVYAQFTVKTNKASDNTNINNVQVQLGEASGFVPYTFTTPIVMPTPLINNKVLSEPFSDEDVVSKKYVHTNFIRPAEEALGKNKFLKNTLVQGSYVDPFNGGISFGAGSSMTVQRPCLPNALYTLSGLGSFKFGVAVRFLDANGIFISFAVSTAEALSLTFVTPHNAAFFQHTVKTVRAGDNTDINFVQLELGRQSVFEVAKPNTGIASVVRFSENRFNKNTVILGSYVDSTTGAVVNAAGTSISSVIPIVPYARYTISGYGSLKWNVSVRFVDEFGLQVGFLYGPPAAIPYFTFAAPKNSRGFQFTIKSARSDDNTNAANIMVTEKAWATPFKPFHILTEKTYDIAVRRLNDGEVYGDLLNQNSAVNKGHLDSRTRPTKDLTAVFFADSIWEQTRADGSTKFNWPNYIEHLEFAEIRNYAKAGAAYRDRPSPITDWQKISYQIDQAIASEINPHLICFGAGTNDGIANLGSYATAMSKATLADLDRTLFYEAVRYAYWKCRTQWPNAIMLAATPLQRTSDTPETLEPMYQAIKKMANRYGVVVADATYETAIVRDFEVNGAPGRFLSDGLHPNDEGQKVYAQYMAAKILQVLM
jgi:lysophospholipase L1-like esterase